MIEYDAKWYRSVLDSISDMVLVKGDKSKLLWANKSFCDYYGMTNDELENIVDSPNSDPDDTLQYVKDDHYVYNNGKMLDIKSEPVTNGDGEVHYFHTIKTPIFDKKNNVLRVVGVSRYINDEKTVDYSHHQREDRKKVISELKTFLQYTPQAIVMLDVKGRIVTVSDAWVKLMIESSKIQEMYFDEYYDQQLPIGDSIQECISSGLPIRLNDIICIRKDQSEFQADISFHPWKFPTEEVGGVIVTIEDVTLLKAYQRSLEVANEELIQFNYRISHDLTSPIKTCRGFINLLKLKTNSENNAEFETLFNKMENKLLGLEDLVKSMLSLNHADHIDNDDEEIDLLKIIDEIKNTKDKEELTDFSIEIDININTPFKSNRTRVWQVLENLISNSIRYRDTDCDKSWTKVILRETSHNLYELVVRDNGIGLAKDQCEKIFELFYRGHSKISGGSGLGLYIVKKHLDHLGATIKVEPLKKGLEFRITFPKKGEE